MDTEMNDELAAAQELGLRASTATDLAGMTVFTSARSREEVLAKFSQMVTDARQGDSRDNT
jgi:hypothetical protein